MKDFADSDTVDSKKGKKFDLISIPAYEFYADNELVEEVYNQLLKTEFEENISNSISKSHFYNEKLFNFFNDCLTVVKNLYFSDDLNLKITACWANKTLMFQNHQQHYHINSIVSGVFYLSDEDSKLKFSYPDPWLKLHNEKILGIGKSNTKELKPYELYSYVKPEKGKLVLFPSMLSHGTEPHRSRQARYSISFNTFVEGQLNPDSITANLKLNTNVINGDVA